MAHINFFLKEPNSSKPTIIYAYLTADNRRYKISIKEKIEPKFWDKKKQQIKRNYIGSPELNERLRVTSDNLLKTYRKNSIKDSTIYTADVYDELRKAISGFAPKKVDSFWAIFDSFLLEKAQEVKPLTLKKYITLKRILKRFEQYTKVKLSFRSIDRSFEIKLRRYLHEELDHLNDTVTKYFECLKLFMNWAYKLNYHDNLDFKEFSIRRTSQRNDIVYLTESELHTLIALDLKNNKLEKIRDIFCFQCFTGQRFSDVQELKWSDIKETENGLEWHLYQVKGNKPKKLEVPIFESAKKLIRKYKRDKIEEQIFPRISNVKFNLYIKDLCKIGGLDEPTTIVRYRGKERLEKSGPKYQFISSHTGRRTFVTLSLEKGLRPEIVMEITGHEDFKTMRKYQKIISSVKNKEARNVWDS